MASVEENKSENTTTTSPLKYIDLDGLVKELKEKGYHIIEGNELHSLALPYDIDRKPKKMPPRQAYQLDDYELKKAVEDRVIEYPNVEKYWADHGYRRVFRFRQSCFGAGNCCRTAWTFIN